MVCGGCSLHALPRSQKLVVSDEVRCPWHHACFSLRTGEALRAPALDPVQCWRVEQVGDKVFVKEKAAPVGPKRTSTTAHPSSIVIVGGGAAGLAAAEMLRREGYSGPVTMISADCDPPVDRPNLSKDYLAGTAPAEWIPLRPLEWYSEHEIDLASAQFARCFSGYEAKADQPRKMGRGTDTKRCCWQRERIR